MRSILNKTSVIIAFTILVLMSLATVSMAKSPQEVAKQADRSIGRVFLLKESGDPIMAGTGFVISTVPGSKDLYFATNEHVAKHARTFFVGFGLKDRIAVFEADVVKMSKGHDMAVLRLRYAEVENYTPPPLILADREIEKGETVYAIGYPGLSDESTSELLGPDGFETTLTEGIIARVSNGTWDKRDTPLELIQHSANVNRGNSGGPLLDICGRVVGVNTLVRTDISSINISSSSNSLSNFLRDSGIRHSSSAVPCNATQESDDPTKGAIESGTDGALPPGDGLPIWAYMLMALAIIAAIILLVLLLNTTPSKPKNDPLADDKSPPPGTGTGVALRLVIELPDGNRTSKVITTGMLNAGAIIGRDAKAAVTISGGKVSRQHAKIFKDGRKLMVMDLGSTNGTKVNGVALRPHQAKQINTSSVLHLGQVKIILGRA